MEEGSFACWFWSLKEFVWVGKELGKEGEIEDANIDMINNKEKTYMRGWKDFNSPCKT